MRLPLSAAPFSADLEEMSGGRRRVAAPFLKIGERYGPGAGVRGAGEWGVGERGERCGWRW
jgi:hypothetical protein